MRRLPMTRSVDAENRTTKVGGFTLVELMVVIAIIAAIIALVLPTLGRSRDTAKAVECQVNLREIYNSLHLYRMNRDHYPGSSGVRFFLAPWEKNEIENDPKNAKIYVCPGDENLLQLIEGDYGVVAEELEDLENFDAEFTSYAGRNQKDYPLDFNRKASQLIVSDDDEMGMNHPNQVNVLYLDGTKDKILLDELDGEEFVVGEDSPLEVFRVLQSD